MTDPLHQRAKRPKIAALAGPYGHPWHPILVTVPIGAWVGSLVFDIGSHVVDDPDFLARGAMWLIALGVIGALVAASIGFLDLLVIPSGTTARGIALIHMVQNLVVTVAYAVNWLWRQAGDGPEGAVGGGQLALNAAALVVLGVSGFLGGKLTYHYGVRVADETTQNEGFDSARDRPPRRTG